MAEETEKESQKETETTETNESETRALTQEDINKLIEAARKQEKDKLYDTITSLRDQVKSIADERKSEKDAREKVEREAQEQVERERIAKLSDQEKFGEQLKKLEERLVKEEQERLRLNSELKEERETAELERYKSELLVNEKDIIPELVRGKTKEEIAASVQTAKERYQQYFEAAVKKAEGTPGRKVTVPGPADPDPDPLDEEDLKGLRGLSRPEMTTGSMKSREEILKARHAGISPEYLKQKDDLLNKVGDLYRKSVRG